MNRFLICFALILAFASACLADEDLGFGYVRKGDHIHFVGGGKTGDGIDGTRIDRPSDEVVEGFNKVFGKPVKPCETPDIETFEVLSEEYTRDKNKVYYKWISPGKFLVIEVPGADAETFESIERNLAKDKNSVWYYGSILKGLDPASVEMVHEGFAWKDADGVWYQHERIRGAEPKTFRHAGSGYYQDKNHAYWGTKPITGADVATFRVLGDSFVAKDKDSVFRSGVKLPDIDAKSTELLLHDPYGYQIFSDSKRVYLNGKKFLHADPGDFHLIDKVTACSESHLFLADLSQSTPVTVSKTPEGFKAETIHYDLSTSEPLAIISAELGEAKLGAFQILPPPGKDKAGAVPDWKLDGFKRDDLVKQMLRARKLLK